MLTLDAISAAALPLIEVVRSTLPARDNVPRYVALMAGGWAVAGLLSDWDETAVDAIPDKLGWRTPEHVQLVVWRRVSAADPTITVGARIGTALFSYLLSADGEVLDAFDARLPVPHAVALGLEIHGLDRELVGRRPRIIRTS